MHCCCQVREFDGVHYQHPCEEMMKADNCHSRADMRKAMKQGRGHQEARRRDLAVRFLMPEGSPP